MSTVTTCCTTLLACCTNSQFTASISVPCKCLVVTQTHHVASHSSLYIQTPPVIQHIWMQPVAPQSLVKPSGRLEREVAPDLGLAGAAQLGIKLGSQSKPAAAPTPAQAPSASKPSSSHKSQGHPSTSGRQALYHGMTIITAREIELADCRPTCFRPLAVHKWHGCS